MPIQKDIFIDNYLQALNNGDMPLFLQVQDCLYQVAVLIGSSY